MSEATSPFRDIPYMGVIYVVAEAMKLGFRNGDPDWCNLGQGQPEVGEMEGAPPRVAHVDLEPQDHAYGPIGGTAALREAVAAHYNRLYRRGLASQYTADNVSIASGGRLALSRAFAALGVVNLGYVVPDYTAYEDMIDYHAHRVAPVLLATRPEDGFRLDPERLERAMSDHGLRAVVLSNPCNPTGAVTAGDDLRAWVGAARKHGTLLALDEFYSQFIYRPDGGPGEGPVSAARFVEDVDRDPVLLFDGLTKGFRYPGWRLGWAVGPRHLVEALGRAASAIDGGPSTVVQRAALAVLEPGRADQECSALRRVFVRKRNLMVSALGKLGIRVNPEPQATFYAWASVAGLEPPFDDGMSFFRQALEHRVMTVPGVFFDVNPGKRRRGGSPYRQWLRFSFGPPEDNVRLGLERLRKMLGR
jgi:aspartate/methionine/tyrosine aminotransferase